MEGWREGASERASKQEMEGGSEGEGERGRGREGGREEGTHTLRRRQAPALRPVTRSRRRDRGIPPRPHRRHIYIERDTLYIVLNMYYIHIYIYIYIYIGASVST